MLKLSDLASRPDFRVGPLTVSPARRLVSGPAGGTHVEPLIMQVLLLLLDARGNVVTRQQLFDQVWGGVMVGDDSLNRAIAKVRRIFSDLAPGVIEIETIPRTGYRVTGELISAPARTDGRHDGFLSRRNLIIGGTVAAASGAGLGLWSADAQRDRQFNELMDRGEQALEYGDPTIDPAEFFRSAVAKRPGDARAQGLLAYARAVRAAYDPASGNALHEADSATRAALSLDPSEPNALLAQILIERSTLDFAATEARLQEVLRMAPQNTSAMRQLWNMLQCVGRSRDALRLVERALAVKPLGAANHFPRAQLLWILGRNAEADRIIDRTIQYWPAHRNVRYARFTIFAFTGRPRAALAMLESKDTAPQSFSPEMVALWRVSLAALDQHTPASIAAARNANVEAAQQNFQLSYQAVMALSALGEVDAAFEIVSALFVVGPRPQPRSRTSPEPPYRSTAWRFAPWLFVPPTASLRADPRFEALCNEIGLTDYWAKRGIKPDYQLGMT